MPPLSKVWGDQPHDFPGHVLGQNLTCWVMLDGSRGGTSVDHLPVALGHHGRRRPPRAGASAWWVLPLSVLRPGRSLHHPGWRPRGGWAAPRPPWRRRTCPWATWGPSRSPARCQMVINSGSRRLSRRQAGLHTTSSSPPPCPFWPWPGSSEQPWGRAHRTRRPPHWIRLGHPGLAREAEGQTARPSPS